MSLFASEETVKIYYDDQGNLVETETSNWFEVRKELSQELYDIFRNEMAPKGKMRYVGANPVIEIESTEAPGFPYGFLAKVIKNWSESVPVTIANLKKVSKKILEQLWEKLLEMYELNKLRKWIFMQQIKALKNRR